MTTITARLGRMVDPAGAVCTCSRVRDAHAACYRAEEDRGTHVERLMFCTNAAAFFAWRHKLPFPPGFWKDE